MFLKKLFCKHKKKICVSNIYGDLRNDMDCCSVWKCERCGKIFLRDDIEPSCSVANFKLCCSIENFELFKLTHQHEDKGE